MQDPTAAPLQIAPTEAPDAARARSRTGRRAPHATPVDVAALRTALRARRTEAIDAFKARGDVRRLLRAIVRETDRVLLELWRDAGLAPECALVAVGGYGRGELLPHSDVDLLLMVPAGDDAARAACVERFIGACWDVGLEIGHSVRTVEQCLAESAADITVRTSLLERRFMAGSRTLWQHLGDGLDAAIDGRSFFHAKLFELRQRHVKFQDTPYSLEPNVKESPGGLRDLQSILWIARAAGLGAGWGELAARGIVTRDEASLLAGYERKLKVTRAWLHIVAGRREDRLVFDLQAQVARAKGFCAEDARLASEQLMQRYYWTAKSVTQLSTMLIQNLEAELFPENAGVPEPIDAEFRNVRGRLDAVDEGLFERDPGAILRAFRTMQRHPELDGIAAPTLRAIWRARTRIDAAFRRDPANRAEFLAILQAPRGVTHELRRMNQWSVLGRYLPAFRRIVGRMQHDLFHVYTVDQHILMVVRNLRRFAMAEHAHEYPFCSQLMSEFDKPWLLVIAALFHDIAKGRGGDHSTLGLVDARRFCRAHGLERTDRELVEFLVEHHLTMSSVAQKQDLSDPETISRFAALVGDARRLTALYLLTVADIRGTSPKVWNAWKGKLLEDLYRGAKRVLGGEAASTDARFDARRAEAVRLLNLHGLAPDVYAPFWSQLDIGYFLRNDAQDIAWQTRVLFRFPDTEQPIVRTRLAPIGEGFQVVVYLPDQPDLFARICGYFDSKNLSVLDARIHTTRNGRALDSFLVVDPNHSQQYRDILTLVEVELAERLARRHPLDAPVRGRPSRRSRYFPIAPQVDLRPDERGNRYLLSVVANDRTGLLYGIARTLAKHGINLQAARIMTLGERVEDVFLIDGPALANARQQIQLENEVLEAVGAQGG
ncbi:MAG: [protein-PII] uridylyltransferase [Burkholderiales bacterium]|jgi:[protein-PII] uridylyltransferase|nr:[protein-PII] uridylyltransferase [Burkholderiales bacterium]MCZ8320111.1 [protein-PII] uridylyltransferase [Novosphingobium sp.]